MNNRFVLVLVGLIIVFGGILWFNKHKTASTSKNTSSQPSNHQYGDGKKSVTLVEYGDFQCPACYYYEPIVQQLRDKYKDTVNFQFRNYPLTQIHQNAMAGHRAAEAASLQGKFWEMHDMLYQHAHQVSGGKISDTEWVAATDPQPYLEDYAKQLGLDINKFKQDMTSDSVNSVINADIQAGQNLGVDSTPSFFIQGKKVDTNPQDAAGFSKLLDAAIAASKNK